MLIEKHMVNGTIQTTYEGVMVYHEGASIVLHARWGRRRRDLGYTTFMPGDRFTEYFYADQWFNIMRIDAFDSGKCRGWYCNVTLPATISETVVSYTDLYLDLWVAPDGTQLVLDEDEFAAAALDEPMRAGALAGLAEVTRWARESLGPFAESDNTLDAGAIFTK